MKNLGVSWSVLAFLLFSTTAFAIQASPTSKVLVINQRDSLTLLGRMKYPVKIEDHQGKRFYTKRFQTADGAIRIDCGQHHSAGKPVSILCAVTVDAAKSVKNVTQIQNGYVPNSIVFKVMAKADVKNMLENMVYTAGTFYTSENVIVNNDKAQNMSVPRFYFNCPKDWVFDVVACEGHLITR